MNEIRTKAKKALQHNPEVKVLKKMFVIIFISYGVRQNCHDDKPRSTETKVNK
jgi:hypothetical protein